MVHGMANVDYRLPEPERRYEGMVGGIAIYYDHSLPTGVVVFRDRDGEVIGTIRNVKQIDTTGQLPKSHRR